MAVIGQATRSLVDGERLTPEEFVRRWEDQPELKFAELLEGVVYLGSPVKAGHGKHESYTTGWAMYYVTHTPGCDLGNNCTWRMGGSIPQPDIALLILPEYGGQSHEEDYLVGAPELAVETAASSATRDLKLKRRLYAAAGVREYIIVLVKDQRVLWLRLEDGVYHEMAAGPDGILRSQIFPGLWLDPHALLNRNGRRLLQVGKLGLRSAEHAKFVKRLAERHR